MDQKTKAQLSLRPIKTKEMKNLDLAVTTADHTKAQEADAHHREGRRFRNCGSRVIGRRNGVGETCTRFDLGKDASNRARHVVLGSKANHSRRAPRRTRTRVRNPVPDKSDRHGGICTHCRLHQRDPGSGGRRAFAAKRIRRAARGCPETGVNGLQIEYDGAPYGSGEGSPTSDVWRQSCGAGEATLSNGSGPSVRARIGSWGSETAEKDSG